MAPASPRAQYLRFAPWTLKPAVSDTDTKPSRTFHNPCSESTPAGVRHRHERRTAGRRAVLGLQTEQAVDFVPDDDREADARADDRGHGQPEAQARELPLTSPLLAGPAPQPLATVRLLNRGRVEKLLLDLLPLRQCHPLECSKTDARAKPAHPPLGIASDASGPYFGQGAT